MAPADLIDELISAAGGVHLLTLLDRQRLVERAADEIATLAQRLEFLRPAASDHGFVSEVPAMRQHGHEGPDLLVGSVLVRCAEEIRRLRVLVWEASRALQQ